MHLTLTLQEHTHLNTKSKDWNLHTHNTLSSTILPRVLLSRCLSRWRRWGCSSRSWQVSSRRATLRYCTYTRRKRELTSLRCFIIYKTFLLFDYPNLHVYLKIVKKKCRKKCGNYNLSSQIPIHLLDLNTLCIAMEEIGWYKYHSGVLACSIIEGKVIDRWMKDRYHI